MSSRTEVLRARYRFATNNETWALLAMPDAHLAIAELLPGTSPLMHRRTRVMPKYH